MKNKMATIKKILTVYLFFSTQLIYYNKSVKQIKKMVLKTIVEIWEQDQSDDI